MTFPISITFANVVGFNGFVARVVNAFGIYSKTGRVRAEVRLDTKRKQSAEDLHDAYGLYLPKHFGVQLDAVLYAIEWGSKTGRLSRDAETLLDNMSGYQFSKLVVKLSLTDATMQDVVDYLNGRKSVTLPIAA